MEGVAYDANVVPAVGFLNIADVPRNELASLDRATEEILHFRKQDSCGLSQPVIVFLFCCLQHTLKTIPCIRQLAACYRDSAPLQLAVKLVVLPFEQTLQVAPTT